MLSVTAAAMSVAFGQWLSHQFGMAPPKPEMRAPEKFGPRQVAPQNKPWKEKEPTPVSTRPNHKQHS